MNLNSLDLNLLVALDALLREASVSRAAMRIGLSQPATSHALQRLRDLIGDPLLVRTGARMELTPRAQSLRAPLAQALEQVRGLFTRDDFDAARSERHFRLMMPDLAVELLMPRLMEKVTKLAPNVTIDVVPWRSSTVATPEFIRTLDLVCSIGDGFKGFHRQLLYTDSDALAVRRVGVSAVHAVVPAHDDVVEVEVDGDAGVLEVRHDQRSSAVSIREG